jgi:hypothetical protein
MRVKATAPVVAIDLDGTSGDYHKHFVWFLNNIYYPSSTYRPIWTPNMFGEFSEALGMEKDAYRDGKLAYRQGGLKRCMPQFPADVEKGGIEQDVQYIRSLGVQVWVTTNRPWMRLDNIDKDTKYWIDNNMGEVDGVIFSQEKYHDLIDNVGKDRILGVFDDLPENIEAAQELKLNVVLREGDHNQWWRMNAHPPLSEQVPGVRRFKDFTYHVEEWIEEHK